VADGEKAWPGYQWARVTRHVGWIRTEGLAKLIEEDQLDPVRRASVAWSKWRWLRSASRPPGGATAVFLVGLQRSGTNMMLRGLESCPEFEVHNENDARAFDRFRLRVTAVPSIVSSSRSHYVLFKPLCDSHAVTTLLDDCALPKPPKAIWAYRGVDGRVRSSVAKFGDANRRALTSIADRGLADGRWEAGGLDEEALGLIRGIDPARLSPESAAALFWYLRNSLYFTLGLDRRADVTLASYDRFVAEPEVSMRALCMFLGFPYAPHLIAHVDARSASAGRPLVLDKRIRALCDELTGRLEAGVGRTVNGPSQ